MLSDSVFVVVKKERGKQEMVEQKIKIALANLHYCSHLFFEGMSLNPVHP